MGGLLLCIISAKLFHRKNPDYPFGEESGEVQAWEIAVPVKKLLEGNLPCCHVHGNTPISALEQLLAEGVQIVGVEDSSGTLMGLIEAKDVLNSALKNRSHSSTSIHTSGAKIQNNA
ncbi:hypothetical protein [Neobacillus mesonae]|uniref:hypothetical protein n=1 Tax=Neobacillus mesonae TaxID=1193713 RepID=UPI00203D6F88|nr:hypothetical protein [Neobacillus mesonae]MCM3570531.1 hypothetical protein [Neobacillus mesonae]